MSEISEISAGIAGLDAGLRGVRDDLARDPSPPHWGWGSPLGSRVVLFFVALVVVLVSLPCLKSLALRENELDAIRTLSLLGREFHHGERNPPAADPRTLGQILAADPALRKRLADAEIVAGGRMLLRHGYLFDLARGDIGPPTLRAWPWRHGSTGLGAFLATPRGELLGHPNGEARWSGPDAAPDAGLGAGDWRRVWLSGTRIESY